MSPLSAWVNFYTIVGTATGALIGLTFVVITLVGGRAGRAMWPGLSGGALGAYNTPTVVHFAITLLACATLSAPWPELAPVALLLGLGGLGGVAYVAVVVSTPRFHAEARSKSYASTRRLYISCTFPCWSAGLTNRPRLGRLRFHGCCRGAMSEGTR
jgi:hypothetical protein